MTKLTGTKGGSGVWQRIISEMPEHSVYIEPFWGRGTIAAKKRPAAITVGCDLDPDAFPSGRALGATMFLTDGIQFLLDYFRLSSPDAPIGGDSRSGCTRATLLPASPAGAAKNRVSVRVASNGVPASTLRKASAPGPTPDPATRPAASPDPERAAVAATFGGFGRSDHFVYLDPPYLGCRNYYKFGLTDAEHVGLCRLFLRLPCPAALSGYWTDLYAAELRDCRHIKIPTVNRRGKRVTEILWMNYPPPRRYHDVRFVGISRRGRERIRRRVNNWQAGMTAMDPNERQAVWEACDAAYSDSSRAGL